MLETRWSSREYKKDSEPGGQPGWYLQRALVKGMTTVAK